MGGYVLTGPDGLLPLDTVHRVFSYLLFYVPVAIIVIFQNQLRQALATFGRNPFARLGRTSPSARMIGKDGSYFFFERATTSSIAPAASIWSNLVSLRR